MLFLSPGLDVCSCPGPFPLKLSAFLPFGHNPLPLEYPVARFLSSRIFLFLGSSSITISGPYFQQKRRMHYFRHMTTVCPVYFGRVGVGHFGGTPSWGRYGHVPTGACTCCPCPFPVRVELCEPVGSHSVHPTCLAISIISPLTLRLMLTSLHVQEHLMLGKEHISW
ncbi:uncharacterized protein EI90DRAFT_2711671 [Cantharellus anzutake]|uniref:uncharacterized protein n=1 Tax=Cantharellus anzutake TaxID=1750568 RepID=UPI001905BB6F|nr:uncharacterized protein EI90DRAFT_2711671 [Cantharellus anzutake]KAF8318338.1 hypothetical protein EI90DRAFT_2711671 [Cantharellus anzutake]